MPGAALLVFVTVARMKEATIDASTRHRFMELLPSTSADVVHCAFDNGIWNPYTDGNWKLGNLVLDLVLTSLATVRNKSSKKIYDVTCVS